MTVLPDFGQKFGVIYADPPWLFSTWSAKGKDRSPEKHYPVMTNQELWELGDDIKRVAADDCALFMWVVSPHLQLALNMMQGWGFEYKTIAFSWTKLNKDKTPFMGLGYWTRANLEICLMGTRGKPTRWSKDVSQVVLEPRGRHSAKPAVVRARIERLFGDVPRLELFARERAPGWTSFGNQLDDIAEAS